MPDSDDSGRRVPQRQQRQFGIRSGAYVFVGGALGASVRAFFDWINQGHGLLHIAFSTIAVNVVGAFFMGMLMAMWLRERHEHPSWDRFKLFAGSGFLGAFTTYSSFAIMIAHGEEQSVLTWVVAIGVVLAGMLAVIAGFAIGERWSKRRAARVPKQSGGAK